MSLPDLAVRSVDSVVVVFSGRLVAYSQLLRELCEVSAPCEETPEGTGSPVLLEEIDGATLRWVRDFLLKDADATEMEEDEDEANAGLDPWDWEQAFFDFPLPRFAVAFDAASYLGIADLRAALCKAFRERFERQGLAALRPELEDLGREGLEKLLTAEAPSCLGGEDLAGFAEFALGAGVSDDILLRRAFDSGGTPLNLARWGDARLLRVADREGLVTDADLLGILASAGETGNQSILAFLGGSPAFRALLGARECAEERRVLAAVDAAARNAERGGNAPFFGWLDGQLATAVCPT
jgi:hypothetical protein